MSADMAAARERCRIRFEPLEGRVSAMYAKTISVTIEELAHNLQQLAEEREGRERRITLRRTHARPRRLRRVARRASFWWISPLSWTAALMLGYVFSERIWGAMDAVVVRLIY